MIVEKKIYILLLKQIVIQTTTKNTNFLYSSIFNIINKLIYYISINTSNRTLNLLQSKTCDKLKAQNEQQK